MTAARDRELWSAVALLGVHCLISACDAVLVYRQKIRSVGEAHLEAADLLGRERDLPELNRAVSHLRKGLSKKNLAAYEDRDLSAAEAAELAEHAERFFAWVGKVLPSST